MPYGKVPIPSRDEGIPVDKFNIMKEDLEKHLTEVRKSHNIPRPRRIRMFEDTDDEEIELPRTSIEDTSHVVDEAPVPIVSLQETYGQTDTEKAQLRPPSALHVENPPVMVFDIAQEEGPPIRTSDSDDDFQHITLSMKEAHGGRAATSKSKASTGRKGTRQKVSPAINVKTRWKLISNQKTRPTAKGEDARAAASSPKLEARSQGKMVQRHFYSTGLEPQATVSSASTKSRKRIRGGCLQVEERPSIEAEATLKQWSNSDESSSDESDDGSDKCPGSK
uniref:Uncharacterized protein n=1 Tax=Amphimedon queenslandica TaxID=400682 RepID=A0A1X7TE91_AMPQE